MKTKTWGKYFLTSSLILILIISASNAFRIIYELEGRTYQPQIWQRTAAALFFYGGIGVILGLSHLTAEIKKKGVWKANWPKLTMLGIPSLFYSFTLAIGIYGGQFLGRILYFLMRQLANNYWDAYYLFPLILGHTIITGFYKYDPAHSEQDQ
ncbi:MAG TPA: hypothetical protein VJ990_02415 [Clostridia bacterium]|nr:hypothetical protein [Clostridia bacterium]